MNKPFASLRPHEDSRARFTTVEFLRMASTGAFDDMKVELVDGELERMNPPKSNHGNKQARIAIRLSVVVHEDCILGEVGIDLGNDTVLACDVAVVDRPIAENRLLLPEEVVLVVEIAQTTIARDMGMKRERYAAAGIGNYWVVDGDRAVVHTYANPQHGEYAHVSTVKFGETLTVPGTDRTILID